MKAKEEKQRTYKVVLEVHVHSTESTPDKWDWDTLIGDSTLLSTEEVEPTQA